MIVGISRTELELTPSEPQSSVSTPGQYIGFETLQITQYGVPVTWFLKINLIVQRSKRTL